MQLLLVLVCFSTLLQASISTPLLVSKPKPVDLSFSCIKYMKENNEDLQNDDVPIILLHGMTQNKESWHGVFEVLALDTKKQACVVDLRNHGRSPWNDEEYDVVAMTEDIKHFMDRINAPKAIVLGHSLGGKIAVHLALNYPEKVEKIIVEDMRPNGVTPATRTADKFYFRVFKELLKLIPQGLSEREAKEEFLTLLNERLAKMNITSVLNDPNIIPIKCSDGECRLSFNPVLVDAVLRDISEVLNESSGRFDGPALFIYGTESGLKVGEDESNIKKLFPNAKLVPVEGANHVVHTFKKFTREVIKFINST